MGKGRNDIQDMLVGFPIDFQYGWRSDLHDWSRKSLAEASDVARKRRRRGWKAPEMEGSNERHVTKA